MPQYILPLLLASLLLLTVLYFLRGWIGHKFSLLKEILRYYSSSSTTLIAGILISFVGVSVLLHWEPEDLFTKVLLAGITETGFALIIAWVVGIALEHGARKEYAEFVRKSEKAVSLNVFSYLYSVNLPRQIFDFAEKHVLKYPIIKIFQRVEYTLPDPPSEGEWVTMKCIFDYTIKNISDDVVRNYPLRFHVSKPTPPGYPPSKTGTTYVRIRSQEFDAASIDEMNRREKDEDGQIRYSKEIDISPGEEVPVRIVFFQHKKTSDSDLFKHSTVCERTELVVNYSHSCYELHVEVVSPQEKFDSFSDANGATARLEAALGSPMLPKNGFFIWWSPRVLTTSGASVAPEVRK